VDKPEKMHHSEKRGGEGSIGLLSKWIIQATCGENGPNAITKNYD